jgi:hypothetical protein
LYDDGGFSGGTMDRQVGGRVSKTQYRHTLTDADQNELNHWSAIFLDKLKSIPEITPTRMSLIIGRRSFSTS